MPDKYDKSWNGKKHFLEHECSFLSLGTAVKQNINSVQHSHPKPKQKL